MINIIMIVIIALLVIAFLKIEHMSRITILIIILLLIVLLFFSFNKMLKSGEINVNSPRSSINAFVVYTSFIENKTVNFIKKAREGFSFINEAIKG
ncbi:MAG: hypothetical protein QW103_00995 [Candidatus Pacearchaeota archaeon]